MIFHFLVFGIFSNSEKRFSLLHAHVSDNCSDSSNSRLKRHCFAKWIENYNAVFVFKFYPAVICHLDQLSESRDEKVLGRAMFYVKVTTPGFLVSLKVINATSNATLNLTKPVAKKLRGMKKLF